MQESLKSQLERLKQNQKTSPQLPYKGQSSLLFDFRYANFIEVDSIYEIGYEGLKNLAEINDKFMKYLKQFFSSTSKYFNREMIPNSELKEYDNKLKELLIDLSFYFHNKNSHMVIEYLIRVYKVNLFLVDDYLLPYLCYYYDNIFIKLLQNINFKENENYQFLENYAKNGIIISKDSLIKYLSDSPNFNFLSKVIYYYIDNISLRNYDYFIFLSDILKYKVSNMNSVNKDRDKNFFLLCMKFINFFNNKIGEILESENNIINYISTYHSLLNSFLTHLNFNNEILKALENDIIIKIFSKLDNENQNEIFSLLSISKLISKNYYESLTDKNLPLFKKEVLNNFDEKVKGISNISKEMLNNFENLEYLILEFILSKINQNIITPFFENIDLVKKIMLLLCKNKTFNNWNNIEDLNLKNVNVAFIQLYKENKLNNLPIVNDNLSLYLNLISSSVPQVMNAIRELNTNKNEANQENILSALSSKFIMFDDEIILNSILNMKNIDLKLISNEILNFYFESLQKYNSNKYSEGFKYNIEKFLSSIYKDSNVKFDLYKNIYFTKNQSLKDINFSYKKIDFINYLNEIIKSSKETNKGLNIKCIITMFENIYKKPNDIENEEELNSIENLLDEINTYKYYEKLYYSILRGYITYISNVNNKLNHIDTLTKILLKNYDEFQTYFTIVLDTHFPKNKQIYLAYSLLKNKTNKTLLNFISNFMRDSLNEELLLTISLLMHLSDMSYDNLSIFFGTKRKCIFSSLISLINNNESKLKFSSESQECFNKLKETVYNDKNELKINKNYIYRLFESSLIDVQNLYIILCNLLIPVYDENFENITIKLLSLFTKKIVFDNNNKSQLLNHIEKSINNNKLCNLLLKNFLTYFPHTEKEIIFFLKDKNHQNLSQDIIDILFKDGFSLNSLKKPEELFIVISFCVKNNINPFQFDLQFNENELDKYLTYIINSIKKNKIDEKQIIYFFKCIIIHPNYENVEILKKTFQILKLTKDIIINICYSIFTLSKSLKNISKEDYVELMNQLDEIFKKLIESLDIENELNYEQEKKIQLILGTSNNLSLLIKGYDNTLIIKSYNIIMENNQLAIMIKSEIINIIFTLLIEFIENVKFDEKNIIMYYKYIDLIVKHSEIDINSNILLKLSKTSIMKGICLAFFYYKIYEKFQYEKNEVLNKFILNENNSFYNNLYEWTKLMENLLILKDTKDKIVLDLEDNIISNLLKLKNHFFEDSMSDNSIEEISEIILNIITNIFNKNKEITEKIIQFSKKQNLFSYLFQTLYNIKDKTKYSKSKNFILKEITSLIPSSTQLLNEYIINEIILNKKETKNENLVYIYKLITKLTNSESNSELIKKGLKEIIKTDLKQKPKNYDSIFYLYQFSIFKYLIHVFNIFDINFISFFNDFIPIFIDGLKINEENINNLTKEIKDLILENLNDLTKANLCGYIAPFLNDFIKVITNLPFEENNNEIIKNLLSQIAKQNEFDSSFESIKYNQTNINSLILYFFNSIILNADKIVIVDVYMDLIKFFIEILKSSQNYLNDIQICLKTLILKINEKQLKKIFEYLLEFLNERNDNREYKVTNSIIVFQLFNTLLNVIRDIFINNYYPKYKKTEIELIAFSNASLFKKNNTPKKLNKKHKRTEDESDINENFSYLKLSTLLIENIKLNFKYSKGELISEIIEELYEPIIEQFKLNGNEKEMNDYYEDSIKDCVLEMFKNIKSDNQFKEFNDELLNLTREENYISRLLLIKIILYLFENLKERYLTLVSDIVPAIADLLEDSNENVQKETVQLINVIEKITGDNYQTYLE